MHSLWCRDSYGPLCSLVDHFSPAVLYSFYFDSISCCSPPSWLAMAKWTVWRFSFFYVTPMSPCKLIRIVVLQCSEKQNAVSYVQRSGEYKRRITTRWTLWTGVDVFMHMHYNGVVRCYSNNTTVYSGYLFRVNTIHKYLWYAELYESYDMSQHTLHIALWHHQARRPHRQQQFITLRQCTRK